MHCRGGATRSWFAIEAARRRIERWVFLEAVPIIDGGGRVHRVVQHHSRHDESAPRRAGERAPGRRGARSAARARGPARDRLTRSAQSAGRRARLDGAAAQEQPAARQAGTGAPPGRGDPACRQPDEPPDPRPARFREHPGGPAVGQQAPAGRGGDGERGAGGDGAARGDEVAPAGRRRRAGAGGPLRPRSRHPAVLEPGRQRREVHARWRHHHRPRRARRRHLAVLGHGHRSRHLGRRAAARLRSLLPGAAAEPRRHRAGTVDRARHRRGARRPHLGRKRGGQGQHLLLHPGSRPEPSTKRR